MQYHGIIYPIGQARRRHFMRGEMTKKYERKSENQIERAKGRTKKNMPGLPLGAVAAAWKNELKKQLQDIQPDQG